MVCRVRNQRVPLDWLPSSQGATYSNAITGNEYWVPNHCNPRNWLALSLDVPQRFIWLREKLFLVSIPHYEDPGDVACTACGDEPYLGQEVLCRDFERTCRRCDIEYLCKRCRWDPSPDKFICLLCTEDHESEKVPNPQRLKALNAYFDLDWTRSHS